jgi:predicted DNA-binding transcriptional regulator AlpA
MQQPQNTSLVRAGSYQVDEGLAAFLPQPEASAFLRLSERTLERHRIAGTGPKFVRLGRRIVYRRADLEAWVDENTFRSTSEVRL